MIKTHVKEMIQHITQAEKFAQNPSFYLYDGEAIAGQIEKLQRVMPKNVDLYYAMKANPHPAVLNFLTNLPYVKGVEIASTGELETALSSYRPKHIIFTGPGKTLAQLQESIDAGIKQIHIESYLEAVRIETLATESPVDVLMRVNAARSLEGANNQATGGPSKFGVDEEVMFEVAGKIQQLNNINLQGLHFFSGSGVLDSQHLLAHFKYVFELSRRFEAEFGSIDIIDLGGGFGIDYSGNGKELDIEHLGRGLNALVERYGFSDKKLILELGRYLVGDSGFYVCEIVDIKVSQSKKHIITSGGMNHQHRPRSKGINHQTFVLPRNLPRLYIEQLSVHNEVVDICGPLCTKDDVLAKKIQIESAEVGDLVVIAQSGAYGKSAAPCNFLSHPQPPEYFIG